MASWLCGYRMGPGAEECRLPLEAGKGKSASTPGASRGRHLDFSPVPDTQSCRVRNPVASDLFLLSNCYLAPYHASCSIKTASF